MVNGKFGKIKYLSKYNNKKIIATGIIAIT